MFRRNPTAATQLLADAAYKALKRDKASEIVRLARSLSPDGGPHRGYRESLRAVEDRAESTDPFAHLVEFGSANNPPYAPLRRAARAAGLELRDDQT